MLAERTALQSNRRRTSAFATATKHRFGIVVDAVDATRRNRRLEKGRRFRPRGVCDFGWQRALYLRGTGGRETRVAKNGARCGKRENHGRAVLAQAHVEGAGLEPRARDVGRVPRAVEFMGRSRRFVALGKLANGKRAARFRDFMRRDVGRSACRSAVFGL